MEKYAAVQGCLKDAYPRWLSRSRFCFKKNDMCDFCEIMRDLCCKIRKGQKEVKWVKQSVYVRQ